MSPRLDLMNLDPPISLPVPVVNLAVEKCPDLKFLFYWCSLIVNRGRACLGPVRGEDRGEFGPMLVEEVVEGDLDGVLDAWVGKGGFNVTSTCD